MIFNKNFLKKIFFLFFIALTICDLYGMEKRKEIEQTEKKENKNKLPKKSKKEIEKKVFDFDDSEGESTEVSEESELAYFKFWSQACFDIIPEYNAGFTCPLGQSGGFELPIKYSSEPLASPLTKDENSKKMLYDQVSQFLNLFAQNHQNYFEENSIVNKPYFDYLEKSQKSEINKIDYQKIRDYGQFTDSFVQKIEIPEESEVCFNGDFHGSVHSLLRNLWRLIYLGYLDKDLKIIKKNFYMIFTGDFVDRGRNGLEVWYTLLLLKCAQGNWDKVHLIRGNHETENQSDLYGYKYEVKGIPQEGITVSYQNENKLLSTLIPQQYKPQQFKGKFDAEEVYDDMTGLYRFLPLAVYIKFGENWVKCCHGGFHEPFKTKEFLSSEKLFYGFKGSLNAENGFEWADFKQIGGKTNGRGGSGVYNYDVQSAEAMLREKGLKAIFRGHQDQNYGLKMFFDEDKFNQNQNTNIQKFYGNDYKNPYWWKHVVGQNHQNNEFKIAQFKPIFTFTTATEGQKVPFDCFGILKTATKYEDCTLKIYEKNLELNTDRDNKKVDRNNKKVIIHKSKTIDLKHDNYVDDGIIMVEWIDFKPILIDLSNDNDKELTLLEAYEKNRLDIIKKHLSKGLYILDGKSIFEMALNDNKQNILQLIKECNIFPDIISTSTGKTLLQIAYEKQDFDNANLLFNYGARKIYRDCYTKDGNGYNVFVGKMVFSLTKTCDSIQEYVNSCGSILLVQMQQNNNQMYKRTCSLCLKFFESNDECALICKNHK